MFLMTDGNPNVDERDNVNMNNSAPGENWALTKAHEAVDKGIQIYCVSVGAEANRSLMRDIADIGGGEEFYADGTIDEYSVHSRTSSPNWAASGPSALSNSLSSDSPWGRIDQPAVPCRMHGWLVRFKARTIHRSPS